MGLEINSWQRIYNSIKFYSERGFTFIDVPWSVSSKTTAITKPPHVNDFWLKDKCLVASAEQGFLELMNQGLLEDEKFYMALTPCFRDEQKLDILHQQYFMKLELFIVSDKKEHFKRIIDCAFANFEFYICPLKVIDLPAHNNGVQKDIVAIMDDEEYELGSYIMYSAREETNNKAWICGTGIAEPRYTHVMNIGQIEKQ